jgi:hypothetical protein
MKKIQKQRKKLFSFCANLDVFLHTLIPCVSMFYVMCACVCTCMCVCVRVCTCMCVCVACACLSVQKREKVVKWDSHTQLKSGTASSKCRRVSEGVCILSNFLSPITLLLLAIKKKFPASKKGMRTPSTSQTPFHVSLFHSLPSPSPPGFEHILKMVSVCAHVCVCVHASSKTQCCLKAPNINRGSTRQIIFANKNIGIFFKKTKPVLFTYRNYYYTMSHKM